MHFSAETAGMARGQSQQEGVERSSGRGQRENGPPGGPGELGLGDARTGVGDGAG